MRGFVFRPSRSRCKTPGETRQTQGCVPASGARPRKRQVVRTGKEGREMRMRRGRRVRVRRRKGKELGLRRWVWGARRSWVSATKRMRFWMPCMLACQSKEDSVGSGGGGVGAVWGCGWVVCVCFVSIIPRKVKWGRRRMRRGK